MEATVKTTVGAVQTTLAAASGKTTQQLADAQTKISTLTQTVTADLKATKDTIDKDVTGNLKILIAKTACINNDLKFNPEDGKCCKPMENWNAKEKKCKNNQDGSSAGTP